MKRLIALCLLLCTLALTACQDTGSDDTTSPDATVTEAPATDAGTDAPEVYYVRTPEQPPEKSGITYEIYEFDSLEDAKKKANDQYTAAKGYAVYDGAGNYVWGVYNEYVTNMMYHCKHIADFTKSKKYVYGDARRNPAFTYNKWLNGELRTLDEKVSCCDRFVTWVLYEMGYTDQTEHRGMFVWNGDDKHNLMVFLGNRGYERIDNCTKFEAGDIVFVNPVKSSGGTPYGSHVFICAGPVSTRATRNLYYRYDHGSVRRIQCIQDFEAYSESGQPTQEGIGNLFCVYRPTGLTLDDIKILDENVDGGR